MKVFFDTEFTGYQKMGVLIGWIIIIAMIGYLIWWVHDMSK